MSEKTTLKELLEEWSVLEYDEGDPQPGWPKGYFAVVNDYYTVAFFLNWNDALRFRLDCINQILNPMKDYE